MNGREANGCGEEMRQESDEAKCENGLILSGAPESGLSLPFFVPVSPEIVSKVSSRRPLQQKTMNLQSSCDRLCLTFR